MTVRGIEVGEEAAVLALFRRCFGDDWPRLPLVSTAEEYMRWKMNSPNQGRHRSAALVREGEIVGAAIRVARMARVDGRDCRLRSGGDVCLDPSLQGQGLYRPFADAVSKLVAEDYPFAFSATDHPNILRARRHEDAGFRNRIDVMLLPIEIRRYTRHPGRSYRQPWPRPLRDARLWIRRSINRARYRRPATESPIAIRAVDRFDERIDAFAQNAGEPFDFIVVRDETYLNWRYCDPAAGQFWVRIAEEAGAIVGFTVTKVEGGAGRLVELLALPGRDDVVAGLLSDAVSLLKAAGCYAITTWNARQHPYRELLRRHGFIVNGRADMRLRAVDPNIDGYRRLLSDAAAPIHITQGDSDEV